MDPLTCRQCGNTFADTRPHNPSGPRPAYCSAACKATARRTQDRDRQRARRARPEAADADRAYSQAYRASRDAARRLAGECLDCPVAAVLLALPGSDYCTEHKAAKSARRENQRRSVYGLTPETYHALYEAQGGRCAICNTHEDEGSRRLHIDHDHSCCPGDTACGQCVRGLLCVSCNTGIGSLGDSAQRLRAAAAYLEGARNPTPAAP